MKFETNALKKLDEIISLLSEKEIVSVPKKEIISVPKKLELEDENFKVNSDGWEKITVNGKKYLQNKSKDIWEFLEGECVGEQLFTYDAAIRETKKEGKIIPTDEQLSEILKTKEDLKNIKFSGLRYTDSSFIGFGSYLYLWSSSPSGSFKAWFRRLYSSYSSVYRYAYNRAYGFSVRCLKS